MADNPWTAHIKYLEEEIQKIGERADKLEAMLPDLESEQKKHALRELVSRMRGEATEHRKFLALVKHK